MVERKLLRRERKKRRAEALPQSRKDTRAAPVVSAATKGRDTQNQFYSGNSRNLGDVGAERGHRLREDEEIMKKKRKRKQIDGGEAQWGQRR